VVQIITQAIELAINTALQCGMTQRLFYFFLQKNIAYKNQVLLYATIDVFNKISFDITKNLDKYMANNTFRTGDVTLLLNNKKLTNTSNPKTMKRKHPRFTGYVALMSC
jgi:hypothetical protein